MGSSLAPALLLSMPQLVDPNFSRTVVLLCKHGDDGALGLVVNRPLVTTGRITVNLDPPVSTDRELQVWVGGPVEPQSIWILVDQDPHAEGDMPGIRIADQFYLSTSPHLLRRLLEPDPPPIARLIVGYAGWGPGQLEDELAEEAWIVEAPRREELFSDDAEGLWPAVLRRMGREFALLSTMPPDPSLN